MLQRPTNSQNGRAAVIAAWISGIGEFLAQNRLQWSQVQGVGLAIPGPYERYGVLGKMANFPAEFRGLGCPRGLQRGAGQGKPAARCRLAVGNDGHCGGVAEARIARANRKLSVLMLMPGSGLGSAFVEQNGLPLTGQTLTAMETAHMAAPLASLRPRRPAHPVRLRQELGLHRALHRPSPACRICWRRN